MAELPSIESQSQETYAAASQLIVVAPKVILATGEEEPPANPYRLVNAILFAFLAGLLTIWFVVHLKTLVTQVIVLGTVTVWSILQIFVAQFKAAVGEDAKKWWPKILGHQWTGRILRALIAVALILFVVTSSLYVKTDSAAGSSVEIRIVDAQDRPYIDDVGLNFARKIAGRPILPVFRSRELTLKVVKPAGYHDENLTIHPGQSVELSFPDDFRKRSLVRIFVPQRLEERTPDPTDTQYPQSRLVISAAGRRGSVLPFGFRTAYLGVGDHILASELIGQSEPDFENERRLELRGRIEPAEIERQLAKWRDRRFITDAWSLNEGEVVRATLEVAGYPRFSCSSKVVEGRVTDCILTEIQ